MDIRLCTVVVTVSLLLSFARGQVTDPAEQNRIQACGNLQPAACQLAKGCRLCRSRWGQSQCFSAMQVSSLPGGMTLVYLDVSRPTAVHPEILVHAGRCPSITSD